MKVFLSISTLNFWWFSALFLNVLEGKEWDLKFTKMCFFWNIGLISNGEFLALVILKIIITIKPE